MTSPDQFMPPNAVNAAALGLAEFYNTTEADYRGQLSVHLAPSLDLVHDGFRNALEKIELVPGLGPLIAHVADALQALMDAIANALGHVGTGFSVSDILAHLQAIPGTVIASITAAEQETRDKIANGLGHVGTGHTAADIVTYLQSIPASAINGITAIEQETRDKIANAVGHTGGEPYSAADIVTFLQAIPGDVIATATATEQDLINKACNALGVSGGEPYTADDLKDALLAIPGDVIASITAAEQETRDKIANALGHLSTGYTADEVRDFLQAIPGAVIDGATTIEQDIIDKACNALGVVGTGHTTTDLRDALLAIPGDVISGVISAATIAGGNITGSIAGLLVSGALSNATLDGADITGSIPVLLLESVFGSSDLGADVQAIVDKIANALGHSGTGHTLANLLTYMTNDVKTSIDNATSNISALIAGVSGTVIADVVTAINNSTSNLQTLLNNLWDIFNGSSGSSGKTLANVLSIGGTFATSVATVISNLQTLLNNLFDAFGGTSGSSGKTLASVLTIAQTFYTAVSTATGNIAALISGVSGTVIADVVAVIGKIQQAIDALVNLFKGDVASGHTVADLVTHATAALKGLLPAVFFNGDGTAAALEGITFHGDGTASYVTDLVNSSAHALVDGLDGTVTTVANALHNMAFGANSFSKGLTQSVHDAGQAIDSLVNRLLGTSGAGKSAAVADTAVAGAAANIAATSATVNTVQTQLGALGLGFAISTLAQTVDFGQYANTSTTPSGFTGFQNDPLGAGQIGVSSGRAAFIAGSTGPVFLRYNVSATATDNQLISVVPTSGASVEIFGRINAAGDTFIYGHAGNGGAAINISVSGTTSNAVAVSHTFQPGATYTLVCGTVTGTKYCDLLCNGVSIVGGALNITASSAGASFRYGGFGITDAAAATVSTFSLSDNTDLLTGPGVPANAQIATSQTSASVTYGDLATVGPAVTVTIGSSGMALVCHSVWLNNNTASASSWQSWAASGANTIAADDAYGVFAQAPSTGTAGQQWQIGRSDVVTGLSAGSTTFTAKYRRSAGTGTFLDRAISVIPL